MSPMARRDEGPAEGVRVGMAGLAASLAAALLAAGLAAWLGSYLAAGAAAHLLAGVPVWLGVLLAESRRSRAAAEAREEARLAALAREGRRPIFQEGAGEAGPGDAAASLDRFRRAGAVALALVTALLELGLAWGLFTLFPRPEPQADLRAAAALCGAAFGLLLLGRYAFVLAARGGAGGLELDAGGRRASSSAAVALLAGVGLALAHTAGWRGVDQAGHLLAGLEALLGVEGLLLVLLEAYRPRRPGEALRPVYDSRLLGLVTAPGDLARSIARTVDYQFGFAISQTWFYRFLERWVAPISAFAAVCLWLLSAVVVTGPGERTLVRRLGALRQGVVLEPGLSFKLPWPIDEATAVPVGRLSTFLTGDHGQAPLEEGAIERALLWTAVHEAAEDDHHGEGEEEEDGDILVLLARAGASPDSPEVPVNLVKVAAAVTWEATDAPAFLARVEEPQELLEVLAERELSFMLSGADLDQLLVERADRGARLTERVRAAAAAHGAGIEVRAAHLTEVHPPAEVGLAFESLTVALEQREAAVLDARAYAARVVPAARTRAARLRQDARVAARTRVGLARADAERFQAQRLLDQAAPGVFRAARLLEALVEAARERPKIVVSRRAGGVQTDLDLGEKVIEAMDLGQQQVPTGREDGR